MPTPETQTAIWKFQHLPKSILLREGEIKLSLKEWQHFEQLLDSCNYWCMPSYTDISGFDGSEWIVEAHLHNKYWVVSRFSPKGPYEQCGKYLISLSGIKEEIY